MGLQNDFWEFDPKYSSWTKIVTKNPPISRCCFAYTNFVNNNKEYFAIFGGISENYIESDLFM
jgi:N-acetylneuraminic acid mutarotase